MRAAYRRCTTACETLPPHRPEFSDISGVFIEALTERKLSQNHRRRKSIVEKYYKSCTVFVSNYCPLFLKGSFFTTVNFRLQKDFNFCSLHNSLKIDAAPSIRNCQTNS